VRLTSHTSWLTSTIWIQDTAGELVHTSGLVSPLALSGDVRGHGKISVLDYKLFPFGASVSYHGRRRILATILWLMLAVVSTNSGTLTGYFKFKPEILLRARTVMVGQYAITTGPTG
jgi:hypothetical protein